MVFIQSQHHACKKIATLPHVAELLTGEVLLTPVKSAGHATLQDRMVCKLQYSFLFPLSNLLAYPIVRSSLLAKIEIGDYYLRQERDYHPLKTALTQSFTTIATSSSLLATMVFIQSQHHACKKSANSDVAACRRTPYRRGVAYPVKSAGRATLQDRMVCKLQYSFLYPLSNLLSYPIIRSSLLAKIEIRDYCFS